MSFEPFLLQKDRWILWAPVMLAIGVGGYFALSFEPPRLAGIAAFILLGVLMHRWRQGYFLVPLLLIALGFSAAQFRTGLMEQERLLYKTYPLFLTGRVAEVEALPEQTFRAVIENISYEARERQPLPTRVRLKLKKGDTPPAAGDVIKVRAMLLPLPPPVMPGAYDFQRHSFFNGIGATGFAIAPLEIVEKRNGGFFFPALRKYLSTHIRENITDPDRAAIVTALLDGEDRDISTKTYDTIRAAGIAHIIAISGLQVTLVAGFLFFVVRGLLASIPPVALRWPVKKITALIAMLGTLFYMGLIGDSVSAERSVIMVCVVMLAVMLDRDPFSLRLAAFAASFLMIFQPETLFGPSFQLSFAAVVALIAFYEGTAAWWRATAERRWFEKLGLYTLASLATTLIATLATAPFSLYHFLKSPLFPGLIANLVAVPLSTFVALPAAIVGAFLMPLGLEAWPLKVADVSVEWMLRVAMRVAEMPHALYNVDAWPMWILLLMVFGGLWMAIWQGRLRWWGILPVLLGVVLIHVYPARADVLVSDSGKLFAVRDAGGKLWLSSKRTEKFIAQSWIEREGGKGSGYWDEPGAPIVCDAEACLFQRGDLTVSFIKSATALMRDCGVANVVVSTEYVGGCAGSKIIDRAALKRGGAQAVYGLSVETVNGSRGRRPWGDPPRTKRSSSYAGSACPGDACSTDAHED